MNSTNPGGQLLRLGIIRSKPDSRLHPAKRRGEFSNFNEGLSTHEAYFRLSSIDFKGARKVLQRFLHMPQPPPQEGSVVHGSIIPRIALDAPFEVLQRLALWPEMEIHIVCVGDTKTSERPEEILDAAAAWARTHGFDPKLTHCEGNPAEALHDYAVGVNAGVIAIGSSCRRVLLERTLGKNVRALLETSDLPLFLSN